MKKFLYLLIILVVAVILGFREIRQNVREDLAEPVSTPQNEASPTPTRDISVVKNSDVRRSVFVPYWGMGNGEIDDDYDEYLYFGITPGVMGVNKDEAGYDAIGTFMDKVPQQSDKKLVVRMLDPDITFPILKDSAKQKSVIGETIAIAKKNNFSGVVLDLEISAVPFDSLINQVNSFTGLFYTESRKQNLEFSIMFYGDTFHRLRPFEVKTLADNADKFYIMSYDFSKSRGNPGPNFPLHGKEVYGYDMTEMIGDFLQFLPPEKIIVVFGYFGYDWEVDNGGVAVSQGEALTFNEIESKFLSGCALPECSIRRKNDSRETEIRYKDEEGKSHIVWFEDAESITAKEKFLREQGVGSFSFWAYSYF